jgi:hypothetical protein
MGDDKVDLSTLSIDQTHQANKIKDLNDNAKEKMKSALPSSLKILREQGGLGFMDKW